MSTSDGRSAMDGWSVKVLIGVHLGLGIWFPGRLSRAVSSFSLFIYFFIFYFFYFYGKLFQSWRVNGGEKSLKIKEKRVMLDGQGIQSFLFSWHPNSERSD